jgi:predicted RNA methylase
MLDVGCGTGSLSAALLSVGPAARVVGVDPVLASYADLWGICCEPQSRTR